MEKIRVHISCVPLSPTVCMIPLDDRVWFADDKISLKAIHIGKHFGCGGTMQCFQNKVPVGHVVLRCNRCGVIVTKLVEEMRTYGQLHHRCSRYPCPHATAHSKSLIPS